MSEYDCLPFLWLAMLTGAWPYVQHVRHPAMAPAAAYLIFSVTFSAMAAVMFGMLSNLIGAARPGVLDNPVAGLSLTLLVSAPGFLLASWLVQRPPRRMPLPGE